MALNPFEQLSFFVPEPKRCFGEIVEMVLRGRLGKGLVQSCSADGRTYVVDFAPGLAEEVTFYQAKYFVRRWQSAQRREVREALQRALREERPPQRWVLCVPTRLALEDLRWFEAWRLQHALKVDVLDGNELLNLLREPSARAALDKMQSWGVTVPGADAPRVRGCLRVSAAAPNSGLTRYLYASVYNRGGRAAKELELELAHSSTGCFTLRHDDKQWSDEGTGNLNPRTIRACRPLASREERLVAVIPICAQTPLPVSLRLRVSTEETAPMEQHLCLSESDLEPENQLEFIAGPGPALVPVNARSLSAAAA